MKNDNMTEDLIEQFLDKRLLTVPKTRVNYRSLIKKYFTLLGKPMETYFSQTKEEYEDDLRVVYTLLDKEGKSSLAKRTLFNPVKQFMVTMDKSLNDLEFWQVLMARTRGAEPESDEAILNKSDIRTILSHGNTLSRALFLMLASSGRRIGEILALYPSDVNLETTPATINIKKTVGRKQTKTGQKTLCFISDEARDAYKAWMLERDDYLKSSQFKGKKENFKPKSLDDPRIFPMSYQNSITIWRTLLIRGGLVKYKKQRSRWDGRTRNVVARDHKYERIPMHPQSLRKFFRSYLGDADLSEYLMGHGTMLTRTYRQMKPEDLAARYLKFMANVTIMSDTPDLSGINESLNEKDAEIQKMKGEIEKMHNEILTLQNLETLTKLLKKT